MAESVSPGATDILIKKKDHTIISFALMTPNQLLVAAKMHSKPVQFKVILLDTTSKEQVAELQMKSKPSQVAQVTRISDTDAAVSFSGDSQIAVLRIEPKLKLITVIGKIIVPGQCTDLAYFNNKFIVTCEENKVVIMGIDGNLITEIYGNQQMSISDDSSGKIFTQPERVAVHPTTGNMYVSDWSTKSLIKLSMEGVEIPTPYGCDSKVLARYTSTEEGTPHKVTLDGRGNVYVAYGHSNRDIGPFGWVEQLTDDCTYVKTIIPNLKLRPEALSYDEASRKLYVGQTRLNKIRMNKAIYTGIVKVYSLSYI